MSVLVLQVRHLISKLLSPFFDGFDLLSPGSSVVALHYELHAAMATGHETCFVRNFERSAATVAGDGDQCHRVELLIQTTGG